MAAQGSRRLFQVLPRALHPKMGQAQHRAEPVPVQGTQHSQIMKHISSRQKSLPAGQECQGTTEKQWQRARPSSQKLCQAGLGIQRRYLARKWRPAASLGSWGTQNIVRLGERGNPHTAHLSPGSVMPTPALLQAAALRGPRPGPSEPG